MYGKVFLVATLLAIAEARFGEEGKVQNLVQALSAFGSPGAAGTLAGQTPGVLLAGANACAKLELADEIIAQLGNDSQVVAAAAALVGAEKNFNPSAVSIPSICSDPSLPKTAALRGIVPLVDPAVIGSDVENANSAKSLKSPFPADGLSVADVVKAQGFSNFTEQASAGGGGGAAAGGNKNGNNNNNNNNGNNNGNKNNGNNNDNKNNGNKDKGNKGKKDKKNKGKNAGVACNNPTTLTTTVKASEATQAASGTSAAASATATASSAGGSGAGGVAKSSIAGLDFGTCSPEMDLKAGRPGRKPDELTFLPSDPNVAKGQQDALNPNIITNRICDQLTNICGANQAAKDACQAAKAKVAALGDAAKGQASTAELFNTLLGFA